jgi:hypothetical protein
MNHKKTNGHNWIIEWVEEINKSGIRYVIRKIKREKFNVERARRVINLLRPMANECGLN